MNIELRWFVTCDEHGAWSEPVLQFWSGRRWEDVPIVTCKSWEEEDYRRKKED